MNNPPQKSDIQILFEELTQLLVKAKKTTTPDERAEIELEIEALKIKRELVQLHQEELRGQRESNDKYLALKFQRQMTWWEERGRNLRARNDGSLKLVSEAIAFAKIAINTLVILNAGAVLAILAFLGNTLKEGCEVKDIGFLKYFIWAVVCAVGAAALGYVSQICFIELAKSKKVFWGKMFRYLGVGIALASLIIFGIGAYSALDTFEAGKVYLCHSRSTSVASPK